MADKKKSDLDTPADAFAEERDELMDLLDIGIDEVTRKVESGRVYDHDNENTRIKWVRALGYLVRTKRQVLKDRELEEMQDRLAALERQLEGSDDGR